MTCIPAPANRTQRGAALLTAMLTVTLVATFAAAALWQQWRATEVESAERGRVQAAWILTGALDWGRLILREDARGGGPDHLGEPWAIGLQEARLSTFLTVDQQATTVEREAFLSGYITDLQGKLNLANLIDGNKVSESAADAFERLFERLGLDPAMVAGIANGLLKASQGGVGGGDPQSPLAPRRLDQLGLLGVSPAMIEILRPHVTLLPMRTTLNLNTAGPEALYATIPNLDVAGAQRIVSLREKSPYRGIQELIQQMPGLQDSVTATSHDVRSRFFEVRGRLRLDDLVIEERSVVQRDDMDVRTLWRERSASLGARVTSPHLQ